MNTGIRATTHTANKQDTFVIVSSSNLSEEESLSKAAPAWTWIKEGATTPKKVPQKNAPMDTFKWGEPRLTTQLGGKGDILKTIM